jgi:putative FmdB family regulatory protein
MPLYDFECSACDRGFEAVATPGGLAVCPACGSEQVRRVYSAFAGPYLVAPRGYTARRSNAERRVREERRRERREERRQAKDQ